MPFATNGEVRIYYELHGCPPGGGAHAAPALVFAHGAGGNAASWWQQVPAFAPDYTVVVFDHRGFGRSHCPPEAQSPRHFESDLIAVLDDAGIHAAALVCQSMGGWTGVRTAVQHPDRVARVVLANTPGAIRTEQTLRNHPNLEQRRASGTLVGRAISTEFAARDPERALLYQQIASFNIAARPRLFEDDVFVGPEAVAETGVPFFVIASDLDPLFPEPLLVSVAAAIGAPCERVEGAGHSTYFEHPEIFNRILGKVLVS